MSTSNEDFIGRNVRFIIPSLNIPAKGTIIDAGGNRYRIKITNPPPSNKIPESIIVSEEDINPYDLMTPIGLTMIKIRSKKHNKPKTKRCSCKNK